MNSHAIVGIVRERPSGKPLEGLRVRAYDRDENTNDFVGEATTRADGGFEIAGDDAAFAEFVEDSPDVVLDIELPNGRTHRARRDLRWSAGKPLPVPAIDVPAEIVEAPRESERGKGKKEKGTGKHDKGEGKKDDDAEHHKHRRDCMRNPPHEDTHVPHAYTSRISRRFSDGEVSLGVAFGLRKPVRRRGRLPVDPLRHEPFDPQVLLAFAF